MAPIQKSTKGGIKSRPPHKNGPNKPHHNFKTPFTNPKFNKKKKNPHPDPTKRPSFREQEIKQKKLEKQEAISKRKAEREAEKKKRLEEKSRRNRILSKRTKKGQPVMKGRIELLLSDIERKYGPKS